MGGSKRQTVEQAEHPARQAEGASGDRIPVLWHLKVSSYNEKARWALDYKRVPHLRRAVVPGRHEAVARKLCGGRTLPVLELDGEAIGDSTRIVAAIERRHPDPPLYPADPEARRRALELEDFFDEHLGPYVRRLVIDHLLADADLFLRTFVPDASTIRLLPVRATFPLRRRKLIAQFGIHDRSVDDAYRKIDAAGERLRAEARPSPYLVGDRFSIADLTLAALVAPAAAPQQFPYPQPQRGHQLLAPLRAALAEAGILDFAFAMYARHRGSSAELG